MRDRPPSPSRFHDQAYRRDAGHDALQQEFLEWLRIRPVVALIQPDGIRPHRYVEGEYALSRDGNIVAYADAIEFLTIGLATTINLFEIKPKIHTVFGIVRQLKAQLALAKEIRADFHFCHAVVPHTDPLIPTLRQHWPHVWAWGVTFEAVQ